ncbi:hypothetical protein M3588_03115 [Cytobacillus sp. AMY 15.2]|uniref:hypothetical protein n=1 Tax=Cytobacillus sp. AMY 15.2 TaxID=2939563 RepID=UPI00135AA4C2|nr:hypothetical protein [Cytobacillus sp. AMY 15.2]MCM3090051.1 hypothetical protein [Cytobacillus sp. AMY 15.2]
MSSRSRVARSLPALRLIKAKNPIGSTKLLLGIGKSYFISPIGPIRDADSR